MKRAHLRARLLRSAASGFLKVCIDQLLQCTVPMLLFTGLLMLHRVCLLHHRGSLFVLHHLELQRHVLTVDSALNVDSQVTVPEIARRIRISWHFLLSAVVMAVGILSLATAMSGLLMVVDRTITSTWLKLRNNLKP